MDVGEMAEMEGVPLWLDNVVLTGELAGFDKVQAIILQSNLKKYWEMFQVCWPPGWKVSF